MKVKASAFKTENLRLTLGKEYEVINMMPSATGGNWVEIEDDIGIFTLIKVGAYCAFGEWEEVK